MNIRFRLNNEAVEIEAEGNDRIVDVLRRDFGILSVKKGGMQGLCGSCTVLLNNEPVPSCMLSLFAVEGKEIITLEALYTTVEYQAIMSALERQGITLCGFCSAGAVLTAWHLIHKHRSLTEEQIRTAYMGAMCRCTDIVSITAALQQVCRSRRSNRREK